MSLLEPAPWRRLVNPSRADLEAARRRFDLHPLVLEDLAEGRQQAKFEGFDEHLYLSLWDITRGESDSATIYGDLALVFNDDQLLVIQRGDTDRLRDLDAALAGDDPVPVTSAISAVYRVLAAVVRDFVELASDVERELEDLESEVYDSRVREDYKRVYRLRQRIGRVDRAASGMADALRAARQDIETATSAQPALREYFTHLENDAIGIARLAAAEHAALDAVASSHESNVAARQNQDMRTISAFAALLAIPTVIGGIWGINFKNLPPLEWEFGWVVVVIGMIVIDVAAFVMFRRRGWLGGAEQVRRDGDRD